MNRYFSMSRRSSLFFGSHKGAERAAVLYTLALSAKMSHLNFFDYLTDIIDKTAKWQPNTPLDKYRNLLPDRWQPSTKESNRAEQVFLLSFFITIRECRYAYFSV